MQTSWQLMDQKAFEKSREICRWNYELQMARKKLEDKQKRLEDFRLEVLYNPAEKKIKVSNWLQPCLQGCDSYAALLLLLLFLLLLLLLLLLFVVVVLLLLLLVVVVVVVVVLLLLLLLQCY